MLYKPFVCVFQYHYITLLSAFPIFAIYCYSVCNSVCVLGCALFPVPVRHFYPPFFSRISGSRTPFFPAVKETESPAVYSPPKSGRPAIRGIGSTIVSIRELEKLRNKVPYHELISRILDIELKRLWDMFVHTDGRTHKRKNALTDGATIRSSIYSSDIWMDGRTEWRNYENHDWL